MLVQFKAAQDVYGHPPGPFATACMGNCVTGEPGEFSTTMAPALPYPCDWPLALPFHQQCTGHCARIAHTPLLSLVYAELGKDTPPLTPTGLPQRQKSNSLHTQDRHTLSSHTYTWCQEPSWSVPTTESMDFCQIGQGDLQVSKEKGRIILMQVLFIPLLVNHQCACITGEASETDTYRSKTR